MLDVFLSKIEYKAILEGDYDELQGITYLGEKS